MLANAHGVTALLVDRAAFAGVVHRDAHARHGRRRAQGKQMARLRCLPRGGARRLIRDRPASR
jgi:hypothetical protein